MFNAFAELYQGLSEHPGAATAAAFAGAWAYERFRNYQLSKALLDLSNAQIKALADLERAFTSVRDSLVTALLRK